MNAAIRQSDCLTAYGRGLDALWDGLLSGQTAISPTDQFAGHGFVSNTAARIADLAIEPNESRVMAMLRQILSPLAGTLDPQTPIILATTLGEIEHVEQSVLQNSPGEADDSRPQVLLAKLKTLLGLRGRGILVSSACASSAAALACGAAMIRHGQAANVLVVTADALSEFVYSGFSTLLSLCEKAARPFDAGRCGLSLGEAAAWALLSAEPSGTQIVGWGSTTDAVHMTAPDRTAGGLCRAIAKAAAMSETSPADVAFIAAHGTATLYSDAMELLAFRKSVPNPRPIFSIKGAIGHTLAAAGLVQILVAARALSRGIVPPTVGLTAPDADAVGWARGQAIEIAPANLALSTNSGFGGVNTAVLLARSKS
jgi:3-oxoacyl-[acyl-carrier-protein] synthase II